MTTYSHHHGSASHLGGHAARGTQYPAATTIGVIVGAVVVGALVGLLLAALIQGPATAQIHRGGGHGRVATLHHLQQSAQSAAAAETGAAAAQTGAASEAAAQPAPSRSHARGGFAVGRTFDVGGSAARAHGTRPVGGAQP